MRTGLAMHALAIAGCLLGACSSQPAGNARTAQPVMRASQTPEWLANGRAIFQTGKDIDGRQITATRPLQFNRCADCHRADGSGGKHFSDAAVSADLRHAALVTHQAHPYTLPLLERALATGVDNEGKPLDPVMPRWRLSPRDLHDVSEYVLTQLK